MTVPVHQDPRLVARGAEVLAGISELCPSLVSATLLTDDGFTVAQVPQEEEPDGRLSSMASSVQALGDAVARQLDMGEGDYVVIAGEGGVLVQRRIRGLPVVLAAQFGADESVASALSVTRASAEWLAAEWSTAGADAPRSRAPRHSA
ncbi:hypothetical protein FB562_0058 [Homoserinimonas aerilata]|uniref:Roadblock/LAMTOR2 domain-containing protein n=1 Tax=Homoserinimonas aerilata TaxID=1162970 RepID=A0A542YG09_9MICO|nr:roadblock/LC7 domain-containing protein [Homoserinimonas aerilata]TQL47016.1 hypothetical protein FB562_0058 [Homoserinimonas aerilata]